MESPIAILSIHQTHSRASFPFDFALIFNLSKLNVSVSGASVATLFALGCEGDSL